MTNLSSDLLAAIAVQHASDALRIDGMWSVQAVEDLAAELLAGLERLTPAEVAARVLAIQASYCDLPSR